MASVTQRIKSIQQPYGGYLPVKLFSKEILDDGLLLNEEENIHSSLVGLAVDYLTRFMIEGSVEKAFHISTLGSSLIGMRSKAADLKFKITGLDDNSIVAACKLVGFDVCYRSSIMGYKPIEDISPNVATIENIRIMVNRSLSFWSKYGPVVNSEPTFEGGYSSVVDAGDGDYVTKDTLWDFKVSKSKITSKHTLQILMYYVMGLHSVHEYFKNIDKLGFFNPRLNVVYICQVAAISAETIKEIENEVICYNSCLTKTKPNQNIRNLDSKKTHTATDYYSVADICQKTGLKKSVVYEDIRSGNLSADKMGNKYVVSESEFERYVEYIANRQKTALVVGIIFIVFLIGCFFFFLGAFF